LWSGPVTIAAASPARTAAAAASTDLAAARPPAAEIVASGIAAGSSPSNRGSTTRISAGVEGRGSSHRIVVRAGTGTPRRSSTPRKQAASLTTRSRIRSCAAAAQAAATISGPMPAGSPQVRRIKGGCSGAMSVTSCGFRWRSDPGLIRDFCGSTREAEEPYHFPGSWGGFATCLDRLRGIDGYRHPRLTQAD